MGRGCSRARSWALAFETDARTDRITLQQVLLGINAHINLDLGIAAVDTTGPNEVSERIAQPSGPLR